jgi:solute carrier family 8 (sodium/calcium exchanger)
MQRCAIVALVVLLLPAIAEASCRDQKGNSTQLPICKGGSGTFFPAFNAYGEADWPNGVKIFVYLLGLFWAFSGVRLPLKMVVLSLCSRLTP